MRSAHARWQTRAGALPSLFGTSWAASSSQGTSSSWPEGRTAWKLMTPTECAHLIFFFNICLFCLFYFLGMHPYGKAAWPYTLEEEETCRRLESEWPDTNIFTLWEVLSLYRNLSVPFFMCNHTRFLYRFEQQVCRGKKKNLVEEPSCTTLLCHEHIVNVL